MGQRWGEYYMLPCHSIPRCRIWSPLIALPLLLRLHKRIVELVSSSQPRHWRNSPEQKNSSYCNTTPGERQVTACRGSLRKNGIRCDVSVEFFSFVFGMKFLVETSSFTVIKYNYPITSNLYSFVFFWRQLSDYRFLKLQIITLIYLNTTAKNKGLDSLPEGECFNLGCIACIICPVFP